MRHEQHTSLIRLLLRIPGMQGYTTRTTLLAGIPNSVSLHRDEGNSYTDTSLLVSQLTDLYLSSGEWALLIFLDNAHSRIAGTMLDEELAVLRQQLVAQTQLSTKISGPSRSHDQTQLSQNTPPAQTDNKPIAIFYCYASEDEFYCKELEKQLSILRRTKLITSWHSLNIQAGDVTQNETDRALQAADIVLLLVSPDFMASDRLYKEQVKPALLQHETGTKIVIPIIVRETAEWEDSEFGRLYPLPREKRPVKAWEDSDAAFASIARDIRIVVEGLKSSVLRHEKSYP
jgi:hypothetical protein